MKKILLSVIALIAMASALIFGGCSEQTFESKSYSVEAEKVSSVNIDVTDRTVEIDIWEGDGIEIEYSESDKEYYNIAVDENGGLKMELVLDYEWTDYIGYKPDGEYRKIIVKLPAADYKSINVTTTNEDIDVGAVSATSVSLNSNGGSVNFDGVAADSAAFTVKNGNISGTLAGSIVDYTIECTIKKGDTNVNDRTGGTKTLKLDCNNGDIEVAFAEDN